MGNRGCRRPCAIRSPKALVQLAVCILLAFHLSTVDSASQGAVLVQAHQSGPPSAQSWSVTSIPVTGGSKIVDVMVEADPVYGGYYVAGTFKGAIQLGSVTLAAPVRSADVSTDYSGALFVAHLDTNNKVIWAVGGGLGDMKLGEGTGKTGVTHKTHLHGLAVSPVTGGLALVGSYSYDNVQFGSFELAQGDVGRGGYSGEWAGTSMNGNIFVVQLDASDGTVVWAKGFGGDEFDEAHSVSFHASGDMFVSGQIQGSCLFDQLSTNTTILSGSSASEPVYAEALFLLKLSSAGAVLSLTHWDTTSSQTIYHTHVAVDSQTGSVLVASEMAADAGWLIADGSKIGGSTDSIIMQKTDLNCSLTGTATVVLVSGTDAKAGSIWPTGLAAMNGSIYMTANYIGHVGSSASANLAQAVSAAGAGAAALVARLDGNLATIWMDTLTSANSDVSLDTLSVSYPSGQLYIAGSFPGSITIGDKYTLAWSGPDVGQTHGYVAEISLATGDVTWGDSYGGVPQGVSVVSQLYSKFKSIHIPWTVAPRLQLVGTFNAYGQFGGVSLQGTGGSDGFLATVKIWAQAKQGMARWLLAVILSTSISFALTVTCLCAVLFCFKRRRAKEKAANASLPMSSKADVMISEDEESNGRHYFMRPNPIFEDRTLRLPHARSSADGSHD
ncbi:hypothetical protein WJX72_001509 [[Myrmecia] bisecta]|uniref:Uncharacterized protein n=1 Tax=[Myrmecia] bisecta TaxID=41462 RepID=A0AAW1P2G5_9CHLO